MKKIFFIFFITSYFVANSQNCIKGKIDQLIELKEKPLAVVLYEENEELVKKLEKKIAKNDKKKEKFQKELKKYKEFILYFNSSIKEIIPDYWRLNNTENVKYITKKELRENELKGYAVLDLTAEAIMTDYDFLLTQEIYVITYGDSEKKRNKAVFKNHLTNINYNLPGYADKELKNSIEKLEKERENGPKILSKENIIISISLSQKYLEKILELNDKITFQEFAEEEMKKNE